MKKVAIIGFGVEGRVNARYYADQGYQITVFDQRTNLEISAQYQTQLGEEVFETDFGQYDLVLRSPSIDPNKLTTARKIWSATNEFFAKCPAKIIGVTGTKGKGTTCSLIASILRAAGKKVHLVGNIGVPALEILPQIKADDIVVYELSSFQLWDLEKSPDIAVVTMVEADHLDVHADFEQYLTAKTNIALHQQQNDKIFYYDNQFSQQIAQASSAQKIKYGALDSKIQLKDNYFMLDHQLICPTSQLKLPGKHNLLNACGAISVALEFTDDYQVIADGLASFTGLDHRLKFVAEKNGVKYYDDSIATTNGSAIAALAAFEQDKIIILGGSDKGTDYQQILDKVKVTKSKIIAIGQTGETIHQLACEQGLESYRVTGLMEEVVKKAGQIAQFGSVVILSPASASFDQYQNYQDRGQQFIKAVNKL